MDFTVWANLITSVGATAFTLLIVQFIKPIKWLQWLDTRAMVFIVANILMQGAAFVMALNGQEHALLVINSFVVSLAAMGTYEETFRKSDAAKKADR